MQCRMLWQYYLENQKISCDGLIYPQLSTFSFLEFITEATKKFSYFFRFFISVSSISIFALSPASRNRRPLFE